MAVQENADYGKVPYFIHVCREASGINRYLTGIQSELKSGTYRPLPVRRVMIPKPDGSQRPLGIPCVKDRIVQMATKIPISGSISEIINS